MPKLDSIQPEAGLVSIVMPCYNRAHFIPEAIEAIRNQSHKHWELILVDDGSTDDTATVAPPLLESLDQPAQLVTQENQGAYAARHTGVKHARGEYIACYDSDDLWVEDHLERCYVALRDNPDVDWVYGAVKRINAATGEMTEAKSFRDAKGQPRKFLSLAHRKVGELHIIEDPDVADMAIGGGMYCGLHSSVIRRKVFEQVEFRTDLRNGEDRLFPIRALKGGFKMAYFDRVHLIYRIHDDNSSAVDPATQAAKRAAVYGRIIDGFTRLESDVDLNAKEAASVKRVLAKLHFWSIGCALWDAGETDKAFAAFRRGMAYTPWDTRLWKAYLGSVARALLGRVPQPQRDPPGVKESHDAV